MTITAANVACNQRRKLWGGDAGVTPPTPTRPQCRGEAGVTPQPQHAPNVVGTRGSRPQPQHAPNVAKFTFM